MASNFGISGDSSSFFSGYFSTGNSKGASNTSNMLSDYAMIRSGSYKKLLNSYYKKNDKKEASGTTEETTEEKANKAALAETKSAATDLGKAAEALKTLDFSDRDDAQTKLKSFVDSYNKTIDKSQKVDTSSVLHKALWMIGNTNGSKNLLKKAGIQVGADNKLTIDNEAFKKADTSTLNTLFKGVGSFADKVSSKAMELKNLSNTALNKADKGNSYTKSGDYSSLDTNSIYNDLFG